MFGLARLSESVPDEPPRKYPAVPEYESDEPIVGVEVDVVLSNPVEPTYATPCDSDGSLRSDENVEEAVEKSPFRKPMVVEVEL